MNVDINASDMKFYVEGTLCRSRLKLVLVKVELRHGTIVKWILLYEIILLIVKIVKSSLEELLF